MSEAVEALKGWLPLHAIADAGLILRALLEPRTTTCERCKGTGIYGGVGSHYDPCPAEGCDQGQIVRPSLAVLRGDLEQVGYQKSGPALYRIASGGTTE